MIELLLLYQVVFVVWDRILIHKDFFKQEQEFGVVGLLRVSIGVDFLDKCQKMVSPSLGSRVSAKLLRTHFHFGLGDNLQYLLSTLILYFAYKGESFIIKHIYYDVNKGNQVVTATRDLEFESTEASKKE